MMFSIQFLIYIFFLSSLFLSYGTSSLTLAATANCPASCPPIFNIDNTTSSCCGAGTEVGCGSCTSSSCPGVGLADCGTQCGVTGCDYGLANKACSGSFCWGVVGGSKGLFH